MKNKTQKQKLTTSFSIPKIAFFLSKKNVFLILSFFFCIYCLTIIGLLVLSPSSLKIFASDSQVIYENFDGTANLTDKFTFDSVNSTKEFDTVLGSNVLKMPSDVVNQYFVSKDSVTNISGTAALATIKSDSGTIPSTISFIGLLKDTGKQDNIEDYGYMIAVADDKARNLEVYEAGVLQASIPLDNPIWNSWIDYRISITDTGAIYEYKPHGTDLWTILYSSTNTSNEAKYKLVFGKGITDTASWFDEITITQLDSNQTLLDTSLECGSLESSSSQNYKIRDTLCETEQSYLASSNNLGTGAGLNETEGYTEETPPYINFSLSKNTIDLGAITPEAISQDTLSTTVETNAISGYSCYIYSIDGLKDLNGNEITPVTDGIVSVGSEEYGVSTAGSDGQFTEDTPITPNMRLYASYDGPANTITTLNFKASASPLTEAGYYKQNIALIAAGSF